MNFTKERVFLSAVVVVFALLISLAVWHEPGAWLKSIVMECKQPIGRQLLDSARKNPGDWYVSDIYWARHVNGSRVWIANGGYRTQFYPPSDGPERRVEKVCGNQFFAEFEERLRTFNDMPSEYFQ